MKAQLRLLQNIFDRPTRTITGSMAGGIEVVLADSSVRYRRAVRQALEVHDAQRIFVIGEAGSFGELSDLLTRTRPRVILMDPQFPDTLGLDAITYICHAYPTISIIALTTLTEIRILRDAVVAGAQFCMAKETGIEQLVSAIKQADRTKPSGPSGEQDRAGDDAWYCELTTRPLIFTDS